MSDVENEKEVVVDSSLKPVEQVPGQLELEFE